MYACFHRASPAARSMGGSGRRGLPPYPYSLSSKNLVPAIEDLAIVASACATIPCSLWASPRSLGSVLDASHSWNSFTSVCCYNNHASKTNSRSVFTYRCEVRKTCDGTVTIGICTWEKEVTESTEDEKWCVLVLSRVIERKCRVANRGSDACQLSYTATPIVA